MAKLDLDRQFLCVFLLHIYIVIDLCNEKQTHGNLKSKFNILRVFSFNAVYCILTCSVRGKNKDLCTLFKLITGEQMRSTSQSKFPYNALHN